MARADKNVDPELDSEPGKYDKLQALLSQLLYDSKDGVRRQLLLRISDN